MHARATDDYQPTDEYDRRDDGKTMSSKEMGIKLDAARESFGSATADGVRRFSLSLSFRNKRLLLVRAPNKHCGVGRREGTVCRAALPSEVHLRTDRLPIRTNADERLNMPKNKN